MQILDGYKMYITAVLVGVVTALQYTNIISDAQTQTLFGLLAAFGLYAAKSAIVKGDK